MGQRHNRRRTRPRSRHRANSISDLQVSDDDFSPAASPTASPILAPVHAMPLITNSAAPSWHIGVEDWSMSQHTVRSGADGVKAEEYRLFGGVPGDDPSLCYNMLEYFGHLDYINT